MRLFALLVLHGERKLMKEILVCICRASLPRRHQEPVAAIRENFVQRAQDYGVVP